jgi:hypothetical protein
LKLFKILFGSELNEVGRMMNLGELRGLLLWVYFMGISTAWPRSGKPGWPIVGDEACGPSGGPVAVDPEG